jgi:cell division protein ZipA
MELSVQDWLIVIGALLIVGVLLDAFRRYRNESRNPIRMGRKPGFWKLGDGFRDDAEPPTLSNAELPGGGARVRERERGGNGYDNRDMDELESPAPAPRWAPRVEPVIQPEPEPEVAHVSAPPRPRRDAPPEQAVLPGTEPIAAPVREKREKRAKASAAPPQETDTEVVVIHVLARQPEGFPGEALVKIFHACDVRHGEMDIFHRHEQEKGQGPVQFSVANVTRPGTFDIAAMDELHPPGLSFFLRLPGPARPLEAFDCMLETARVVARNLDGELQDQSHSVFTTQTAEHCRQRIREFVHRNSRARR